MDKLVKNIPIFIVLYIGFQIYTTFTEHQEKLEQAQNEVSRIEGEVEKKKKEVKLLTDYYNDIEKAKANIEATAVAIEKIQKQLPSEVSDTENLEFFSKITRALNLKNVSLMPGKEEDRGFYISKEYILKANGTFLQFLIFFEKLSKTDRIYNFGNILLSSGLSRQKGRFQMIDADIRIESYRYNQNYKEDRGLDQVQKDLGTAKPGPRKRPKKNVGGENS